MKYEGERKGQEDQKRSESVKYGGSQVIRRRDAVGMRKGSHDTGIER